jgi:hypothetical protein
VNFCYPNCLSQEFALYRAKYVKSPGKYGCCTGHYFQLSYAAHLSEKIDKKYGRPNLRRKSPCGYHAAEGCRLADHKPPVCIAYVCGPLTKHIEKQFGILYDWDRTRYRLEFILFNFDSIDETNRLKKDIQGYIDIVKQADGKD